MTAPKDPARTVERSYEVRRKEAQEACRRAPCDRVNEYPPCVFCPHEKRGKQDGKGAVSES